LKGCSNKTKVLNLKKKKKFYACRPPVHGRSPACPEPFFLAAARLGLARASAPALAEAGWPWSDRPFKPAGQPGPNAITTIGLLWLVDLALSLTNYFWALNKMGLGLYLFWAKINNLGFLL
jgi:hypothetical protein